MKAWPRQRQPGSNAKTLRRAYTSRDLPLKKPEVIIKFISNGQTGGPDPSATTSFQNARPTNQMVIWYHSLGETEKQIKGLQLHSHKTSGYPPCVVLAMNDSSFMLLEISQDEGPQSVDVIRLTDSELKLLPPGSIHVDFFQILDDPNATVNLRLVIAICQEVFAHISSLPISENVQSCSRLFAIMLFVSVVRQRLPINRRLIESIRTIAAVDDLWAEILSPRFAGQILWESEIVDRVHRITQTGIREAAQDQLEHTIPLPATTTTHDQVDHNGTDVGRKRRHLIKLVTAWLESTVHLRKPCTSNTWDTEWDRVWSTEWDKNWKEKWESHRNCCSFDTVRVPFMPQPPTNALLGTTSGRAMIELASVANSIEPEIRPSALKISMALPARGPGSTVADREGRPRPSIRITPPVGETGKMTNADTHSKGRPTIAQLHKHSWFESWHSMRRPDSGPQGNWLPVWEAAWNLAWTLEWANHREEEITTSQATALPVHVTNSQSPDEAHSTCLLSAEPPTRIWPGLSSQSRRNSAARMASLFNPNSDDGPWGLLKHIGRSNSSQELNTPMTKKKFEPDLETLSQVAWDKAYSLDPALDKYIQDEGEKIFKSCQDEIVASAIFSSRQVEPLTSADVTEVFKLTLEKTWQASWESAWKGVMEEASHELKYWMPAEGGNYNIPSIPNVRELAHYNALVNYMNGGDSKEENHWHIRSAFKALNLLHRFVAHSVPICYKGVMKINRYVEKASL